MLGVHLTTGIHDSVTSKLGHYNELSVRLPLKSGQKIQLVCSIVARLLTGATTGIILCKSSSLAAAFVTRLKLKYWF